MRKNGLNIELRKSILKCLEEGIGYRTIAASFGINVSTAKSIRDIYRRGELSYFDGKKRHPHFEASEKFAVVHQFLDSGLPLKTFAREECLNPATLRLWVRKYREGTLLKPKQEE